MPSLGLGLGLEFIRHLTAAAASGSAPESIALLADDANWYEVSIVTDSPAEGYRFDFDDTPVSPGEDETWVFENAGTKYEWGLLMTGDGLVLGFPGTTSDPVTPVQMEASDGAIKSVVVAIDGGEPVLQIV